MRRLAVVALLVGGCDAAFDLVEVSALDARSSSCYGTGAGFVPAFCPAANEIPLGALDALFVDTDTCAITRTQSDNSEVCVLFVEQVELGSTLRASGSRPLVIVATTSITVSTGGRVDVSSSAAGIGANGDQKCDPAQSKGADGRLMFGGGGGAGGSSASAGGAGATGNNTVFAGGQPAATIAPMTIRGGCPGGAGGGGSLVGPRGGSGGGAVYLIAGDSITIAGTIAAYGGGGIGGGIWAGGGGGGAGGFVGLDARRVELAASARIRVGGGGGGEAGGSSSMGATGAGGATGLGGFGQTNGGDGGAADPMGGVGRSGLVGMAPDYAGGGGGGGGGFVRVYALERIIDPDAESVPPLP